MNVIQARYEKAKRLADFIEARGVADQARTYSEQEQAEIATQAGEEASSIATWGIVLADLAQRANPSDPFDFTDRSLPQTGLARPTERTES